MLIIFAAFIISACAYWVLNLPFVYLFYFRLFSLFVVNFSVKDVIEKKSKKEKRTYQLLTQKRSF